MKNKGMNVWYWPFPALIAVCVLGIIASVGAQEKRLLVKGENVCGCAGESVCRCAGE
jgi:hypothetical protein